MNINPGGPVLAAFANSYAPLYFTVSQLKEVMSTEQPCDLACEFGDGLYHIQELPQGFPQPGGAYLFFCSWLTSLNFSHCAKNPHEL